MIAMQYSFVLPADYDMSVIDQRIKDKGPMLDGFPGLRFKAYLSARKSDQDITSPDNLYAPFYLWEKSEGISNFLAGPGFSGLTRDFGWPKIRTWIVWHTEFGGDLSLARFATREQKAIIDHSNLASLRSEASEQVRLAIQNGALASLVAFDPEEWSYIRFHLWTDIPNEQGAKVQHYRVGHISEG